MIARNFCLSFVDTQRLNVKFVGNFYIRYKKMCQIAVARLIKNKTFSQVLFFVLPLVVGMFAKCHKRRNLHFCFVGEGNFAAPHSKNLMTGVVYAKRLGVRVVVVQRFYMEYKGFFVIKVLVSFGSFSLCHASQFVRLVVEEKHVFRSPEKCRRNPSRC